MTDTLDAKIRGLFEELLDAAPPAPPIPEPKGYRRTVRRRTVVAAVAVVVVACALGAGIALAVTRGSGTEGRVVAGPGVPSGSTVIIATDRGATFVDLAARTTRAVSLPHWAGFGDRTYGLVQTGGWLVYPGPHGPWAAPLDHLGAARYLGDASTFAPSGVSGRVWLITTTEHSASDIRIVAREVSVDGHYRGPKVNVPDSVLAGFGNRLIIGTADGLAIWNPSSRREVGRISGSFHGVSSSRAAIGVGCDGDNHCAALDVVDANARIKYGLTAPPALRWVTTAGEASHDVFSPDGRYLAARATAGTGQSATAAVYVVDLATGRTIAVPDSNASQYTRTAWTANDAVVFETRDGRLGTFEPSTGRVRALPVACCGVALTGASPSTK